MKKSSMVILFCTVLCATVFAQPRALPPEKKAEKAVEAVKTVSEDGFVGRIESNTIIITEYSGTAKDLVIPEKINNLPIVSIGANAFNNKGLTSVKISNYVTSIGDSAFEANQLTVVVIPNSVTSIGISAFANNKITSVKIGNYVTTIGNKAFLNNKLKGNIIVPNAAAKVDSQAFDERVNVKIGQFTSTVDKLKTTAR